MNSTATPTCAFEHQFTDFDGTPDGHPCGAPATHCPVVDDAYSKHLRDTGAPEAAEAAPAELPLCDEHHAQMLTDLAGQDPEDPYRFWIVEDSRTITVGWTKHGVAADRRNYAPFFDSYRPGQPQHELVLTVQLPVAWDAQRVAGACFLATNAPGVGPDSPEGRILAAIQATGYRGAEAHFSLSVGDTVTVGDTKLACARFGWQEVPR